MWLYVLNGQLADGPPLTDNNAVRFVCFLFYYKTTKTTTDTLPSYPFFFHIQDNMDTLLMFS